MTATFLYTNWQRWSSSFDLQNNTLWNYCDTTTTISVVDASGFFDPVNQNPDAPQLNINDMIYIETSDVAQFYQVTAISPDVTISAFQITIGTGAVGTTNLANNAVTTAKIANNAVGVGQLALNTIQYVQVAMTAAQWNGMYATPFQIIAAPGAGLIIQAEKVWYDMAFVAAQYAAGGVVNLQYDSTANGAGVAATADTAAATITGLAASSIVSPGGFAGAFAQSTTVNKGLFMSNKSGAFTTGDGTWKINVAYRIITA
jgi:hypothetical protein